MCFLTWKPPMSDSNRHQKKLIISSRQNSSKAGLVFAYGVRMSEVHQVLLKKTASRPEVLTGKRGDPVAHGMSTKLHNILP